MADRNFVLTADDLKSIRKGLWPVAVLAQEIPALRGMVETTDTSCSDEYDDEEGASLLTRRVWQISDLMVVSSLLVDIQASDSALAAIRVLGFDKADLQAKVESDAELLRFIDGYRVELQHLLELAFAPERNEAKTPPSNFFKLVHEPPAYNGMFAVEIRFEMFGQSGSTVRIDRPDAIRAQFLIEAVAADSDECYHLWSHGLSLPVKAPRAVRLHGRTVVASAAVDCLLLDNDSDEERIDRDDRDDAHDDDDDDDDDGSVNGKAAAAADANDDEKKVHERIRKVSISRTDKHAFRHVEEGQLTFVSAAYSIARARAGPVSDGLFLRAFRANDGLKSPAGLYLDPTHDELYVTAEEEGRVVVFDCNTGSVARELGADMKGFRPTVMSGSCAHGGPVLLLVCDAASSAIRMFARDGEHLGEFGAGSVKDVVKTVPTSIFVDDAEREVYVAQSCGAITVLSLRDGKLIRSFSLPEDVRRNKLMEAWQASQGHARVGARVVAKWTNESWYHGVITSFDAKQKQYHVEFDDGDKRDYDVTTAEVRFSRKRFRTALFVDTLAGEVYVSDGHHSVCVFDRQGTFLRRFGRLGQGKGRLMHPSDLFVDVVASEVYICDTGNRRISVFTCQGKFRRSFSGEGCMVPRGVFVDGKNGVVYVVDQRNKNVSVFGHS